MILTCDIGNTSIKTALFDNNELTDFRIFNDISLLLAYIRKKDLQHIAVSSVVPHLSDKFKRFINNKNINFIFITNRSDFNLEIDYKSPHKLGIDRICASEGALYLYKKENKKFFKSSSIVAIDFGTATTINFIKGPGTFIGGIIAPGIETMLRSLTENTAQLPLSSLKEYNGVIGKNTRECISSGIVNSQIGLIQRAVEPLMKKGKVIIYITGGNYEKIKKYIPYPHSYEKALVHYGISAVCSKK